MISLSPQDILPHYEIKRRPTGFITPNDLAIFLKSRGIDVNEEYDDEDNMQKPPETEPKPEATSELGKSDTVIIETETRSEIAKHATETGTIFKEGFVNKKGAVFRDEGDDNKSRYRLKNIISGNVMLCAILNN